MSFQYVDYPKEVKALLQEVFSDCFMQERTRFRSFEGFQYSSAVFLNWGAEQLVYDDVVFDHFVRESTDFSSWDDMVRSAVDLRYPAKAGCAEIN